MISARCCFFKNELCVKIVHGLVKPKFVFVTAERHSLIILQLSEKWPQSLRGAAVYNKLKWEQSCQDLFRKKRPSAQGTSSQDFRENKPKELWSKLWVLYEWYDVSLRFIRTDLKVTRRVKKRRRFAVVGLVRKRARWTLVHHSFTGTDGANSWREWCQ